MPPSIDTERIKNRVFYIVSNIIRDSISTHEIFKLMRIDGLTKDRLRSVLRTMCDKGILYRTTFTKKNQAHKSSYFRIQKAYETLTQKPEPVEQPVQKQKPTRTEVEAIKKAGMDEVLAKIKATNAVKNAKKLEAQKARIEKRQKHKDATLNYAELENKLVALEEAYIKEVANINKMLEGLLIPPTL